MRISDWSSDVCSSDLVMAIGRTFQESFQKALRGLEVGVDGLNQKTTDREKLQIELGEPGPERIWYVGDAFAQGFSLDEVQSLTRIDPWFLAPIKEIVDIDLALAHRPLAELDYQPLFKPNNNERESGRE